MGDFVKKWRDKLHSEERTPVVTSKHYLFDGTKNHVSNGFPKRYIFDLLTLD